jgi:hypothetical protein
MHNDGPVTVASSRFNSISIECNTNDTLDGMNVTNNTDVTPISTGPLSIDANGI